MSLATLGAIAATAPAWAADSPLPDEVRVAVYADAGAPKKGVENVRRCLSGAEGFAVETVSALDIRRGALDAYDVAIFPGGSGGKQAETLGQEGRERVREFVENGGGFVGICAGAYLASAHYRWSLHLLDARVVDSNHWARGTGDVELRISAIGRKAFNVEDETATIYYGQGPLLAPGGKAAIADYELLAAYETEIAKNGAPRGVMKGAGAIARGAFGAGRVVCFSPHPERTPAVNSFVGDAVRWSAAARVRRGSAQAGAAELAQ